MTIPARSDILIEGVNLANLTLAVLLAKSGAIVLLIDEKPTNNAFEPIILDQYCFNFLLAYDFEFSEEELKTHTLQSDKFTQQSFKILGNNLCSIIWGVDFNGESNSNQEYLLKLDGKFTIHQTKYLVSKRVFKTENGFIALKKVFLLAWRLTGVFVKNNLENSSLNSYFSEEKLLQNQFDYKLKETKNPTWLKLFKSKSKDYHLVDSKASLHLSMYRSLQAGELTPDLSFFDEKTKEYTSLHHWCNYKYFSVIVFGSLSQPNLFSLARWVQLNYPVQLFYLPWSKRNDEIFKQLNILEGLKKTIIVRPDRYLGLIHDGIDLDVIDNYLANFVNMKEKSTLIDEN